MLKHQRRAKFRLAEVEHPEDPGMIDALKNTELAHGHAAKAFPLIGRGGTGIRINPDATRNPETCVLCSEVLPAIALTKKGAKEIVANPPIAAGRPDACFLDGSRGGASDIRVDRSRSAQLGIERTSQRRNDATVRGAAWVASQEDPARGAQDRYAAAAEP